MKLVHSTATNTTNWWSKWQLLSYCVVIHDHEYQPLPHDYKFAHTWTNIATLALFVDVKPKLISTSCWVPECPLLSEGHSTCKFTARHQWNKSLGCYSPSVTRFPIYESVYMKMYVWIRSLYMYNVLGYTSTWDPWSPNSNSESNLWSLLWATCYS